MSQVTPSSEAVEAGVDAIDDLLTMLNVDPNEVPEHGGPSTAEVLATAVLRKAGPFVIAAKLDELSREFASYSERGVHTALDWLVDELAAHAAWLRDDS